MRDGVRLAVDVHAPQGGRAPTILHMTRYFRSVAMRRFTRWIPLGPAMDSDWETRKRFLAAGYAWVDVCVRGSGASFGTRPCPWSASEIDDSFDLVEWIAAQPWSDGQVGATGISYAGTSAELLGSLGHPAVKAIAPRFSCFDVYPDVAFPGGLHLHWFTRQWGRFNDLLDKGDMGGALALNVRLTARGFADLGARHPLRLADNRAVQRALRLAVRGISAGVAPAGGDLAAARAAVADHLANYDVHAGALSITSRDDVGISAQLPDATIDVFSPHLRAERLKASGAAVLNVSGWQDGGYANAATKRHGHLGGERSQLLIGPWDHGGSQDISEFNPNGTTDFDHAGELLDFFDAHLRGRPRREAARVRYFTVGAERWREASQWPPESVRTRTLYLEAGRQLAPVAAAEASTDTWRVDNDANTGHRSRWNSLLGLRTPIGVGDCAARCERMLCYTSAPLEQPLEVTGHPVIDLWLAVATPDAAVFAYLMEVEAGGRVRYITEGMLRARHRAGGLGRSYLGADARPMIPDEPARLRFQLLPTSYELKAGSRLRVGLASSDTTHFAAIDGPARWDVRRGGDHASCVELPVS